MREQSVRTQRHTDEIGRRIVLVNLKNKTLKEMLMDLLPSDSVSKLSTGRNSN
jgi:hypothetical protein